MDRTRDAPLTLWTVGHSTRTIEDTVSLLRTHHIQILVDVRTVPRSRHNPQFNRDTFGPALTQAGFLYRHEPELGGLRKSRPDSVNVGWKNAAFRGYADYMQTDQFWTALDRLMEQARLTPTAIMCAEAVPWRCHRSLIADALLSRNWSVRHILSPNKVAIHVLTTFAKIDQGRLTYPRPMDASSPPLLF
jgi:uncharacterized protein (DUF488 family)